MSAFDGAGPDHSEGSYKGIVVLVVLVLIIIALAWLSLSFAPDLVEARATKLA